MRESPLSAVRKYFDQNALSFDSCYDDEGTFLKKFLDGTFRRSIQLRYAWVLNSLSDLVPGKRVLDVGCGSGRYCVALAKAGAGRVVGVDISSRMLELARKRAEFEGVLDRCHFLLGDFLTLELGDPFDFSLAMGFFEYVREPQAYLRKLAKITRQETLASFPTRWHWLTPQRKLRYLCRGVTLYFYTKPKIVGVMSASGWTVSRMEHLDRDYVVSGVPA